MTVGSESITSNCLVSGNWLKAVLEHFAQMSQKLITSSIARKSLLIIIISGADPGFRLLGGSNT